MTCWGGGWERRGVTALVTPGPMGGEGPGALTSPSHPNQDKDIMSSMQIFENVI